MLMIASVVLAAVLLIPIFLEEAHQADVYTTAICCPLLMTLEKSHFCFVFSPQYNKCYLEPTFCFQVRNTEKRYKMVR